ncbi:hypothetical protein AAC691_10335 [Nguyenibacter vanlangensis]|uniref:Uncharacterized protein n=1 Tax=Nguyenibacter vanlangensis TaxID=1216886 RepID=A0ABZ3DAD2_9PROT
MTMLDTIKKGRLPLIDPAHAHTHWEELLQDGTTKAARLVTETHEFGEGKIRRLRTVRRPRRDFLLPSGAAIIYLEIWSNNARHPFETVGILYNCNHNMFSITEGRGWPGRDPHLLPALFRIEYHAGGMRLAEDRDRGGDWRTFTQAGGLLGDALRALDAVAREKQNA